MPIVLAIEPDRRQAAHLTAIVRHQVGAELVIAQTTEGALDAIGNRVPDLVLVPALLSPQDDAALAAALRVIAAAAHVRTLTIPVLATGATRATRAAPPGLLAKWRRSRATSPEPDGCDPAVFGEQISTYLQEAAAERAELEEEPLKEEPIAIASAIPIEPDAIIEPPAPPVSVEQPWTGPIEPQAAEPVQLWAADPGEQPLIDLSDEIAGLSDEADAEIFDDERIDVYSIAAEAGEPACDAFGLLPAVLEPPAIAEPIAIAVVPVAETFETPGALFVDALEPPRADIEPWVPMYLTPGRMWPALEGMPAETPVARAEQPDWIELVASLRQDLERRRTEPASAIADPIVARSSEDGNADAHRLVKTQRAQAKQAKPVQDEWGFFDPEQCGFSTLLAKLEEITGETP